LTIIVATHIKAASTDAIAIFRNDFRIECHLFICRKNKSLDRTKFCQGRINLIRGATLIHGMSVRLQDTDISPTTNVRRNVAEYSVQGTFDCALRGPFDNLFLTRFPATRALCEGIIAVISASTVSIYFVLYHRKKALSTIYVL
jgi:hypothetical protein